MLNPLVIFLFALTSLAQTETPSSAPSDVKPGSINGNGKLHLIPGLGHAPHIEAPEKTLPPLVAFLRDGLGGHQG